MMPLKHVLDMGDPSGNSTSGNVRRAQQAINGLYSDNAHAPLLMPNEQPQTTYENAEIARLRNEQSKSARKINALRETIDQLHDRIARLQAGKKNKESEIARLNRIIEQQADQ